MECRKYESQFNDYLDGELSLQEREILKSHLKKCLSCYRKWTSLQKTQEILSQLPSLDPPAHSSAVVMARLKERGWRRRPWSFANLPGWLPLGLAATAVLLISLTLWQVLPPSSSLRSLLPGGDNLLSTGGASEESTAEVTTRRRGSPGTVPVMVLRVKDFSRADRELESMLRAFSRPMVQEREPTQSLRASSARLIDVKVPGQRFPHLVQELHKIGQLDQSQVERHSLSNPQKQRAISIRIVVVRNGTDIDIRQLRE